MSSSDSHVGSQTRTYKRSESVVFLKTKEAFGGLSNMAAGFPLRVNGIFILTSEALYQACRFPHLPDVQRLIIGERSPMTAKMRGKPHRENSRPDWDRVRTKIMRWCLRVKLAQNRNAFGKLLLETGERPIVEESRKDDFWGANPIDEQTLVGMNVLGRLLMELREMVKTEVRDALLRVEPLAIPDFLLSGHPIETVFAPGLKSTAPTEGRPSSVDAGNRALPQPPLFDARVAKEAAAPVYLDISANVARITDLKPYLEYRESGVQWLGPVPAHWDVRPAFGVYVPNHERNRGMREKTVLSLSYGRIVIKPPEKLHGLVPESFETYQIVNPGDVVLRTTDLQNDHTSLRVGIVKNRGIITSAYLALRMADGVIPEFGYQFLNVWDMSKAIYGYGSGLRQGLDFSHFKRMPVALPPPVEQKAIVRFLNWANGRLERTIRAKRKVIALLSERKQAIAHHAVTRGLNPKVEMYVTGDRWFPHLPKDWRPLTLRRVINSAIDGPHFSPTYKDSGVHFLSARNIKVDRWSLDDAKFISKKDFIEFSRRVRPERGDILYTKGGTTGVARVVDLEFPFQVWVHVAVLKLKRDSVDPSYLATCLNSPRCYEQSQLHTRGATNQDLGLGRMKDIVLPVPRSIDEQRAIVSSLQKELSPLMDEVSNFEREIELLREYRIRLVADVVTGKLDVREVAARLPQDVVPNTLEDDAGLIGHPEVADEEAAA